LYFFLAGAVVFHVFDGVAHSHSQEGIASYYVRYDVKTQKNSLTEDRLLMIPSTDDFRADNFSQVSAAGEISAISGESAAALEKRIRDNALKAILVENGLKSLAAKDTDTVVSYEGVMVPPFIILNHTYNKAQRTWVYTAAVLFSPIAFPDQWETQHLKHRIKSYFDDFFHLFK
jgi:hypothetical protein